MKLTLFQRKVVAAIRDGHDTCTSLCRYFRGQKAVWQVSGGISNSLIALSRKGVIGPYQQDTADFYQARWKVLI